MRRFIGILIILCPIASFANETNLASQVLGDAAKLLPKQIKPKKRKRFYVLPNSFSFRPFAHKSLETEGFLNTDDLSLDRADRRKFNFLSFWSISHIHYPDENWSWGIRFSPSINYYRWEDPGDARFLHATYNAKLLWHFSKKWGSTQLAFGAGPMYVNGELSNVEEKKLTFSPRFQMSYYKFFGKKFFFQVKYNKHYLLNDMFKTDSFSLDSFSSTGIYLGYYFSKL